MQGEPETKAFKDIIAAATTRLVSATSLLEASMVIAGRGAPGLSLQLDELIERTPMAIVPFDHAMALLARDAFLRFGKGRHPAGLTFGDCASYALAKSRGVPLLFKGEDFSRTDIRAAA